MANILIDSNGSLSGEGRKIVDMFNLRLINQDRDKMWIFLLGAVLVYLAARLVFNVPFMGSHLLFLFGTVLFLII